MKTFITKVGASLLAVAFALAPVVPAMAGTANYVISGTLVVNGLQVDASGVASANTFTGQSSAQHISVDWGDPSAWTVFMNEADLNFTDSSNNGIIGDTPWSTSHTYTSAGTYTIRVSIHHAQAAGQEGGLSTFTQEVVINPQCNDGIDNDQDGKIDFPTDPGCSSSTDDDEFNTPPATGTIVVDKVTDPAQDAQSFAFTTTGAGYDGFSLTDAAAVNSQTVNTGNYSVAETAVAGWTQTSAVCVSSIQDIETPGSLELDADETIACTFTNTKDLPPPPVTQCNDGVDNADAEDTLVDMNDPGCSSPEDNDETNTVPPPVTQCNDGVDNADAEDVLVDMADPGCSSPEDNDETDAVVDNTTITILKQTTPEGDPQTFSFEVNDIAFGSAIADNGSTGAIEVVAGSQKIEEIVPTGWTQNSISCVNEAQQVVGGHDGAPYFVTLVAGDDITCTVTNTKDHVPPPPQCTVTIVSDATNTVVEKGSAFAKVLSFVHPAWATISGASWIWGDDPVVDSTVEETQTFAKSFVWDGPITSAVLTIASDNGYSVTANGSAAGGDPGEFNYGSTDSLDLASYIVQGNNELKVAVTNMGLPESNPEGNPAGLNYKLVVTGTDATCGDVPTEQTDYCPNIEGTQSAVPEGYHLNNDEQCERDSDGGGHHNGGGSRISLGGDNPPGEVLGAQTEVLPAGAPNTGAGGTSNTAATASLLGSFMVMLAGVALARFAKLS